MPRTGRFCAAHKHAKMISLLTALRLMVFVSPRVVDGHGIIPPSEASTSFVGRALEAVRSSIGVVSRAISVSLPPALQRLLDGRPFLVCCSSSCLRSALWCESLQLNECCSQGSCPAVSQKRIPMMKRWMTSRRICCWVIYLPRWLAVSSPISSRHMSCPRWLPPWLSCSCCQGNAIPGHSHCLPGGLCSQCACHSLACALVIPVHLNRDWQSPDTA